MCDRNNPFVGLGGGILNGLGGAGLSALEQLAFSDMALAQQQALNLGMLRQGANASKTKLQKAQEYAAEVRKRKFPVKRLDNVGAE